MSDPGPPSSRHSVSRRHSAMVAAGIGLSRLSGLVREAALARFIGVGSVTDALGAASRIPNLLQNLLGEGALSASFIPVYARLLSQGRDEEAGRVAGAVAGLLAAVAGAFVVVGVVFAGPITRVVAAGFVGEKLELTIRLVRIITPGIGFLVLSAWCLGVLNSHRRFFLSYVAPVLWNAAQITALLALGLRGVATDSLAVAVAWAMLIGGALQLAVQLPAVLRLGTGLRASLDVAQTGVRRVLRNFWPVVTGRGVVQLLSLVETFLASLLATGAVALLGFATRLYLLPISLFGMSVAASALPDLSRSDAAGSRRLTDQVVPSLGRIAFFVAPSALAFFVIGDLLVATIYQSGAFTPVQSTATWLVLAGASVGLLANTSSRLLQSVLYGAGDTRSPALYSVARLAVAAAVGAVLMLQFDRLELTAAGISLAEGANLPALTPLPPATRDATGPQALRLGAVGLTLAAGMSSWLEFALLRRALRQRFDLRVRVGGGQLPRIVAALVPMAIVGLAGRAPAMHLPTLVAGPLLALVMGVIYLVAALGFGVNEARELWLALRRRW